MAFPQLMLAAGRRGHASGQFHEQGGRLDSGYGFQKPRQRLSANGLPETTSCVGSDPAECGRQRGPWQQRVVDSDRKLAEGRVEGVYASWRRHDKRLGDIQDLQGH